jgi:hypothetical protein
MYWIFHMFLFLACVLVLVFLVDVLCSVNFDHLFHAIERAAHHVAARVNELGREP